MVNRALDAGINFFDTADIYTEGRSETITGQALKGRRDDVILASKVRGRVGERPNDEGLSRRHIHEAVENSLRRLQTDYLDIYYLHQPDYVTPLEETAGADGRYHSRCRMQVNRGAREIRIQSITHSNPGA